MAAAKRIADEQELERAIQQKKAEKAELAREKERMRLRLRQDKIERFGLAAVEAEEAKANSKTPAQLVENGIKMVTTLYPESRAPGVAKTCLKTINTFVKNVKGDPSNEKFRKVNLENAAVQKRVGKINGGKQILKAVGFIETDDGSAMIMSDVNDAVLENAMQQMAPHID